LGGSFAWGWYGGVLILGEVMGSLLGSASIGGWSAGCLGLRLCALIEDERPWDGQLAHRTLLGDGKPRLVM
jgi:hypothetical protein